MIPNRLSLLFLRHPVIGRNTADTSNRPLVFIRAGFPSRISAAAPQTLPAIRCDGWSNTYKVCQGARRVAMAQVFSCFRTAPVPRATRSGPPVRRKGRTIRSPQACPTPPPFSSRVAFVKTLRWYSYRDANRIGKGDGAMAAAFRPRAANRPSGARTIAGPVRVHANRRTSI